MRWDTRAVIVGLVIGSASPAWAQARLTGADVAGAVKDESGGVVPGASVSAVNTATSVAQTAITDQNGRYRLPALPPGVYRVSVDLTGFAAAARESVELHLGQSVDVDFTITPAQVRETVTANTVAPPIEMHASSVSQIVGRTQIERLPINGRNFISFATLTAGAAPDNTPAQGAITTSGLSFAGQRARNNNIMVDGLDNNDAATGGVRAVFSQEAVDEFQVIAHSFTAEFGKASGGVVNIVTKSGGKELHGSAFVFGRDKSLNASDHFEQFDVFGNPIDQPKAPFRQAQFGGTAGGPIRKERTFFFASFERLDQTASRFVTVGAADAATLTGLGFPVTPGANTYDVKQTQVLGKVDHHWNPQSSLTVRTNVSTVLNENIEPFGGLVARSAGAAQDATDYSLSASQTNVIGGRLVNEARVQFARQDQLVYSLDPACGGLCSRADQGGPLLEIAGVANVGRQRLTPNLRAPNRLQLMDTVSLFKGSHHVKAGVDVNHIHSDFTLPLQFGGRFIFPGMSAVLAGTPAAYSQGYGNDSAPYSYSDLSLYVQDEWRLGPRVTLNYGLRYQTQFWPRLPYDVSNLNGSRFTYELQPDRNDVSPRVGVAFDPQGRGRTAIHAAYGRYYDSLLTGFVMSTAVATGTADHVRSVAAGPAVAVAAWRAPGHRLTESQVLALLGGSYPSAVLTMAPDTRTPSAHHASAGLTQAIGDDLSVAANVLYVRGKDQLGSIDYNPRVPSLGDPQRRPNDIKGVSGTSTSILQYTSFAESWYRGLTLSVRNRFGARGDLLVSYTLSDAEDNTTDIGGNFVPQSMGAGRNPADPNGLPLGFDSYLDRGPSVWDQRHRLAVSGFHQLPAGLELSAILVAASGRPFTPLAGVDLNGDGNGGGSTNDRARTTPGNASTSVGRNSERLPATVTADVRLSRRFRIGSRDGMAVEPIVEVFNLFNRVNYSDVNNVFGTGAFPGSPAVDAQKRVTYGRFTQAQPPRQVQIAVKFTF